MPESLPDSVDQQEALARFLSGESSPEEREAVRRWAAADPRRQRELEALQVQLDRLALPPRTGGDVDAAWHRVAAHMEEDGLRSLLRPHRRRALAAAAVLALVALGGLTLWQNRQARPITRELTTSTGRRDSVRFSDGSRIVMGAGSRLSLVHRAGDRPREVRLEGEAYFDIPHDTARPFTVRTDRLVVTDLGTVFSVRSAAGGATEVRVMQGAVSIRPSDGGDSAAVLHSGDLGSWHPGEGFRIFHGLSSRPPAWLEGRLEFEDTSLPEVGRELKRWYGIELRLTDSILTGRHLTATFAGEPPARVAEIIALTLGANLELRGDTAILSPRQNRPSSR